MFTYINTKFVYFEKHLKSQLIAMYKDLSKQKCDLETQVIQNLLTLAVLSPNDFAYVYMNGRGYMTYVLGEVIHLIKCIPVDVMLTQPSRCYNELPVKYQNKTWFMTPWNHLLTSTSTEVDCNEEFSSRFYIFNSWY